ncbi:MAG TPA: phosphoadenylyl-sulfate reductase [Candidatus Acidoferrum sp.]|nr:phosphoadenylyl-sulfate reductase [Candidatus Acidoferrum sp.]
MSDSAEFHELENHTAEEIVRIVLSSHPEASPCATCSFQAEDIIVLELLRKLRPDVPVLFLDTGYHFAQTYAFRDKYARETNIRLMNVLPKKTVAQQESEFGILYGTDPTKCCQLRKVEPLMESLEPFGIWFTGLRREQSPTRKNLKKVEHHRLPSGKVLLKISPLADWTWKQVWRFTAENGLSYLPQYDDGYLSIGCQPCTALPADPNNPRSGRWGGKKLECGIHTVSENLQ